MTPRRAFNLDVDACGFHVIQETNIRSALSYSDVTETDDDKYADRYIFEFLLQKIENRQQLPSPYPLDLTGKVCILIGR